MILERVARRWVLLGREAQVWSLCRSSSLRVRGGLGRPPWLVVVFMKQLYHEISVPTGFDSEFLTQDTRCLFRKFLASFLDLAFIRPWGIEKPFESLGPWAEPRSSLPLLATGLTERDPTHQWWSRIGPTIGMGMMPVVVVEEGEQSRLEIR